MMVLVGMKWIRVNSKMWSEFVAFVRQRQGVALCFSFARTISVCYFARRLMSVQPKNHNETKSAAVLAERLKAAAEIYCPDVNARRRFVKARVRQRKAEKIQRDQSKLNKTGIRKLRREKIFTTPNLTPLIEFQQQDVEGDPDFREVVEPQNCYICKQDYTTIHHFYDQLCPACGELNFRKRTESADLRGRVALLTGGRVKIGYQAGIKLLRAGAQLIVR